MKNYLILLVLVTMIMSCQKKNEQKRIFKLDLEDFGSIKSLILDEYNKRYSGHFTIKENCLFENYILNEFEIDDFKFEGIYSGILMTYLYCPYNNFNFTVMKGEKGFYFYGLMDIKYLADIEIKDYKVENSKVINPKDELSIKQIPVESSMFISQIIESEFPKVTSGDEKIELAVGLLDQAYKSYNVTTNSMRGLINPIDNEHDLIQTLHMVKGDSLTDAEKQNSSEMYSFSTNMGENQVTYYSEELGLISFKFSLGADNEVLIDSYYTPQQERWVTLLSDLDRPEQYDCE